MELTTGSSDVETGPFRIRYESMAKKTALKPENYERGFRGIILTNKAYLKAIHIIIDV